MKPYRRKLPTPRFLLVSPNAEGRMILLRMTIAKKHRVSFSTGIRVNPKHWNAKAARLKLVRGKEKEYRDINKRLAAFSEIAQDIYIEYDNGQRLDRKTFLEQLAYRSGRKENPAANVTTLFQFVEQFIEAEQTKPNAKRGTWKKYLTVFNHLREFAAAQGKESLDFSDINWQFRNDFINWLYSPPRSHSQNNAAKILAVTKQFMREAEKRGLHSNRIYTQKGFGLRRTKTTAKVRLTFAELEELAAVDLTDTPRLERARDLFLVGCFTGARFSDWHKVSRENIIEEPEGQLIQILTQKVRNRVVVPVFPVLAGILEKYGYQLPEMSIQHFNRDIKTVCKIALKDSRFQRIYSEGGDTKAEIVEKWERVSSHAARRSFASNFWEAGIPAALLMQITGHATEKQFFEYIDISQEQAARQFAKMALEVLKKRE
ncbi:site-specific integrase [Phaeodactylibacter xiamenensis]|uniref:site-specific integrase n=1 Tax=Phaeodactylibacter xiamenensis TaxID=1524460 RepID=UPI0024A857E6|nr:site-specific integrase [Phaeodactylibacter xiamenensis]